MDDLLAARLQMAISLGFRILFAVAGMAMPLLMVLAEWRHRRTGERVYRELAERWSKGTAILFAVCAVSGTVLSFELGLLWPRFEELSVQRIASARYAYATLTRDIVCQACSMRNSASSA